ncbi:MAG TPA: NUDIX hydrolase [Chloroflexota bacterium]
MNQSLSTSIRYLLIRLAMHLPVSVRRSLTWLSQATFTVGVSAVIFDQEGRVLLLRHRFRESHGWELPGGFVERRERLEDALRREIREETGYEIEVTSLLSARVSKAHHLDVCYLACIVAGSLHVERREILDARFFPVGELPSGLGRGELDSIALGHGVVR